MLPESVNTYRVTRCGRNPAFVSFKSILGNRKLQRLVLGWLRRWMPLTRWGSTVIVSSYSGVAQVLERSDDFSVIPIYQEKMRRTSGDFYLGMDDTPQYQQERELTNQALRAMDLLQYRNLTRQHAERALADAQKAGTIDVVQELSWLVPVRICEEFFGVSGSTRRELFRWVRYIFQHLFLNLGNDPVVAERAEGLAVDLRRRLVALVAERKAEPLEALGARTDFLSRLVQLQAKAQTPLSDDTIVRNVGGVILGSVDTISRAVVNALEELLERPQQLELAQAAARRGDRETVAAMTFEALRFNPHNPLIIRRTLRRTTLRNAGRELEIPAGSRVIALTYAAMFDPMQYEAPNEFRPDRQGNSHLQFGFGLHRCFGESLARMAVIEILTPLLCRTNLKRASGKAGKVTWDGPFPDHFQVTFDESRNAIAT